MMWEASHKRAGGVEGRNEEDIKATTIPPFSRDRQHALVDLRYAQ